MRVPLALSLLTVATVIANGHAQDRTSEAIVTIASGTLEGLIEPSGVRSFKGVPFAAAPVGILRWKAPQALKKWNGTRKAVEFGARCMQGPGLGLVFRSGGASEDCLYLNIWAPGKSTEERSPVLVYFHGAPRSLPVSRLCLLEAVIRLRREPSTGLRCCSRNKQNTSSAFSFLDVRGESR